MKMENKENYYKNIVVNKPWGYEYLAYENEHVGLWFLHIEKDQETSLHCHPKKDTGLIVLEGSVDVCFLSSTNWLGTGKKIMIRKGLFHSTKALAENGANIFEIETPKLKHDLVRLEDKYGRKATPYEGKSSEQEKIALLEQSDLFVMPSIVFKKSVEGFGITFIEAACYGKASIGGVFGGEADAIIDGKTGYLCDGNDLNSLYETLLKTIENENYKKLGNNALVFSRNFNWNKIIKKYIELI